MRFYFSALLLGLTATTDAFISPLKAKTTTSMQMFDQGSFGDADSMKKASLEQMKNLKPGDIDKMLKEMDEMNPIQKSAMKAMNMDPEMMKKSLEMMRDNPAMIDNARKVMETMSPEELVKSSQMAQDQLKNMSPEDLDRQQETLKSIPQDQLLDASLEAMKAKGITTTDDNDEDGDDEAEMITGPGSSSDFNVVNSMFKVAEFMSEPPTQGGVTFTGFYSLPVIQLLSGEREFDLSMSEVKECWAEGSLGASRVDRVGFGRVWDEVQEYFEQDIMTEARKEAKKKTGVKRKNRGSVKSTAATTPTAPAAPKVGENMSREQLTAVNDQVKNMSPGDLGNMLDAMKNIGPEEEARMKSMGLDASMMKQTAAMLKENPQMAEMAQKMMQDMSPEDLLKSSQQAQDQMASMSESERQAALDAFKESQKK